MHRIHALRMAPDPKRSEAERRDPSECERPQGYPGLNDGDYTEHLRRTWVVLRGNCQRRVELESKPHQNHTTLNQHAADRRARPLLELHSSHLISQQLRISPLRPRCTATSPSNS
jgi:hypothetical protein